MDKHAALINTFYTAFQDLNGAAMSLCYHPDVHFSDPAFPDLRGPAAGAMWRMLCARAVEFSLEFSAVAAGQRTGGAHWEARYVFSATGRPVHNRINARFEFQDDRIIRHVDDFSFWRWSRMALGPVGLALGWTPMLKGKVQAQAAANLARFMREESAS